MSAASPKIADMTAEKAHEPSMEEILASIRRIIADDQAAKPAETPAPKKPPAPPEPDDVLDLADFGEPAGFDEPVHAAAEPVPLDLDAIDFDAISIEPEPALAEPALREPVLPEPEPEPEPPPAPAARPAPPPQQRASEPPPQPRAFEPASAEPLISAATDASVNGAFNALAHTVLSRNARTLDDLVADMLRPMLKAWLDDNLPVMVERLVRAEIERVSRGR